MGKLFPLVRGSRTRWHNLSVPGALNYRKKCGNLEIALQHPWILAVPATYKHQKDVLLPAVIRKS